MAPEMKTIVTNQTAFWFSAFLLMMKGLRTFFHINQIVAYEMSYKKGTMHNFDISTAFEQNGA